VRRRVSSYDPVRVGCCDKREERVLVKTEESSIKGSMKLR